MTRNASTLVGVIILGLTCLYSVACGGGDSPTRPTTVTTPPPPPAAAPPGVSTQNPVGSTQNVEARTSQTASSGLPTQVFDDFTLSTATTVRTVNWQGIYCAEVANAPAPAATATGFIVSFYPDQAGRPNVQAPIQSTTYPLAQTGQTFDRNQTPLNCGQTPTGWAFYSYSVALSTPFTATAGVKYWVSIQAVTPSYAVFWGWRDGTPDNRSSVQLFNGVYTSYTVDRAYALVP